MGTTLNQKIAMAFLELLEEAKLKDIREEVRRVGYLLRDTIRGIETDCVKRSEDNRETTATFAAHRERIEKLEARAGDTDREIGQEMDKAHKLEARVHALATRVDALESGRTGVRVNVQRIEVNGDDPDRFVHGLVDTIKSKPQTTRAWARALAIDSASKDRERHGYTEPARNGGSWEPHSWVVDAIERAIVIGPGFRTGHAEQRHAFPPYGDAFKQEIGTLDPMATAIDRMRRELEQTRTERDGYRDGQERMTKARDAALKGCDQLGSQVTNLQRKVKEQAEQLEAAQRNKERAQLEVRKATEMLDGLAMAAGVQPIGSREQNHAAVLEWINRAKALCSCYVSLDEYRRVTEEREAVEKLLAEARERANKADERAKANSASVAEFANKLRALEEQAARRDKLAADRLATFEALQDRIRTVADEQFGPFPVQSADDALSAIEQGCFFQRQDVETGRKLFDTGRAWSAGNNDTSITEALEAYETERKRVQAMREVGMARFYGPPVPENDCQAGTCDCPSGPSYEVKHKNDPGDADIPF